MVMKSINKESVEWLNIFWDAWQPHSDDEAKEGRMAYLKIRKALTKLMEEDANERITLPKRMD